MKNFLAVALIVFAIPCTTMAQATAERWTSADGTFSVVIPDGWERIDRYVGNKYSLAVGPSQEIARKESRNLAFCAVATLPLETGLSQDEVNERIDLYNSLLLLEIKPSVVHETRNEISSGIRVITLDVDSQGSEGKARTMQRIFITINSVDANQNYVGCNAVGTAYVLTDIEAMRSFINSLTIEEREP